MPNTPSKDTSGSLKTLSDNILEMSNNSRISSSPLGSSLSSVAKGSTTTSSSLPTISAAMLNNIMNQKLSPSSLSTISAVSYDNNGGIMSDYYGGGGDSLRSSSFSRPNTPKLTTGLRFGHDCQGGLVGSVPSSPGPGHLMANSSIVTGGGSNCGSDITPLSSPLLGTAAASGGASAFGNTGSTTVATPSTTRNAIQISWNKTITSATNVSDITDLMYMYGNQFNAVNIATSLHRLASQFRFDVRRYSDAIRMVLDKARDTNFEGFSPRELANVVWAMAKTEMPCKEDVFDHISRKAINSFSDADYTPQAIANLLWGMAKAGYPNELLFDHLSNIAIRSGLHGFNAQNLSNSLWALSTAQLPNYQLFNMIGNFIVDQHSNLKGFSPQNMANAVWAMAKVNMPHIELFDLISTKATESKFSGFKPQEIANLVWAMSTCRLTKIDLILQVFTEIKNFGEWKTQEISNLVWAVAIGKDIHTGGEGSDRHGNVVQIIDKRSSEFLNIVFDEIDKRGLYSGWKSTELSNLTLGLFKLIDSSSGSQVMAPMRNRLEKLIAQIISKVKRDSGFVDYKLNELLNIVSLIVDLNLIDSELIILISQKVHDLYGNQQQTAAAAPIHG